MVTAPARTQLAGSWGTVDPFQTQAPARRRSLPADEERPLTTPRRPLKPAPKEQMPRLLRAAMEREFIPDALLTAAETERAVVWDEDMPRSYQLAWTDDEVTFQHADWNPSEDRTEPAGHPNREFPWHTGGTDHSDNARSFKLLVLPEGQAVTVRRGSDGYRTARFPTGSRMFEVLTLWNGEYDLTFEIRELKKQAQTGDPKRDWAVHIYRPVKDRKHLEELTADTSYASALAVHYETPLLGRSLSDSAHVEPVFSAKAAVDELPPMPAKLVEKLLMGSFWEVTDRPWAETPTGLQAFAPTAPVDGLGIVPHRYQGGYFSSRNCLDCHATVMQTARRFDDSRVWYGRVRGGDGIFSLPVADPVSIGQDGERLRPVLNRELVRLGMLQEE